MTAQITIVMYQPNDVTDYYSDAPTQWHHILLLWYTYLMTSHITTVMYLPNDTIDYYCDVPT